MDQALKALLIQINKKISEIFSDESGQAVTEYILILATIVFGATQLGRQIIKLLDTGVLRLGSQLEKDLKTGRISLSVWQN